MVYYALSNFAFLSPGTLRRNGLHKILAIGAPEHWNAEGGR